MRYAILIPLFIIAAVAVVGKIKFDYVDVPFLGEPVTYVSANGETFELHRKADESVLVRFSLVDGAYMKAFQATRAQSASGARYEGTDGRFEFWSKGAKASIFDQTGKRLMSGDRIDPTPNSGEPIRED